MTFWLAVAALCLSVACTVVLTAAALILYKFARTLRQPRRAGTMSFPPGAFASRSGTPAGKPEKG